MEHMNLYLAELVGTALFMVLGLGVCANISLSKSGMCGAGGIVAALGWGVSMVTVAVCFGPVSGAHCNPAVTVGFWAAGNLSGSLVPGYIISQCIGASVGALIIWQLYKDHLDEEECPGTKLGVFTTGPSIQNFWRKLSVRDHGNLLSHVCPAFPWTSKSGKWSGNVLCILRSGRRGHVFWGTDRLCH